MLYGLININWFDLCSVGFTVVAIVLVQILNVIWASVDDKTAAALTLTNANSEARKSLKINELKSLISNDSTTNDANTTTATNGKLQKQQSEQIEKYVSKFQKKNKKYLKEFHI